MTVTMTAVGRLVDLSAGERRNGSLLVTGATVGTATPAANTIPHGLGFKPRQVNIRAFYPGGWTETQDCDSTNFYMTITSGGVTTGIIEYNE